MIQGSVKATRFSAAGDWIEDVEVAGNRVGDTVYLTLKGKSPIFKHFQLSINDWRLLNEAVDPSEV